MDVAGLIVPVGIGGSSSKLINIKNLRAISEANVVRRLYLSLGKAGGLPASGQFAKTLSIYGYDVTVRGAVVDGIPRIATAFIP